MSKSKENSGGGLRSLFAAIVIPSAFLIAALIYMYILGDPSHFQGGNPENNPIPGDAMGIIHKGGIIVPLLIGMLMLVITFALERLITISRAKGKGSVEAFVTKIRSLLASGDINTAISECDKQKGSVANVIRSGLKKYKEMESEKGLDKERKLLAIQKDIEEATQLELPMLEKNLVVISTIASIATLMGLLGTVLGMIKSFSAMAQAGAPDAIKLSTGISEALINTAFGIGTSALAIILYNYFTSKIDGLTYGIDEAGFSIVNTFASNYKEN
jgi:biopolymer transport protein ExbB